MKLSLSYAVLHGPIHSPDTGVLGPVLQAKGDSARKGTPMFLDTDTGIVTVDVPVAQSKGKGIKKFLIPFTGFTHTVQEAVEIEKNSKA